MSGTTLSIFISYARTDSTFVDRLEADLQARNFHTWVDRRKLEGGQVWLDQLERAIEHCQILLVVLSPGAVDSKYVRMEYRYAQKLDKIVIPLEYQTCSKVPIDLNSLQWINFTKAYEQGLESLLIALSPIEPATLPPPSPPAQASQTSFLLETKEPDLVEPHPAPAPPDPDLRALYRAGIIARAEGNYDRAAVLWQQVLDRDPQFQQSTLTPQMKRLQEELHPRRVTRLREQAKQARDAGRWGQEIGAWQALLSLEPEDSEAKQSIPIAEHNQRYAWMYENALQFIEEGLLDPAKLQLQLLWQDAPQYGDPAQIREKINLPALLKPFYSGSFTGMGNTYQPSLSISTQDVSGNITAIWKFTDTLSETFDCQGTIDSNEQIILRCKRRTHSSDFAYQGSLKPDGSLQGTAKFDNGTTYEGSLYESQADK